MRKFDISAQTGCLNAECIISKNLQLSDWCDWVKMSGVCSDEVGHLIKYLCLYVTG